jgi:hypothetical protein
MDKKVANDNESELFEALAHSLDGSFLSSSYNSVSVLLLYWRENDQGFEKEICTLQHFFVSEYGFSTAIFAIPSQRPEHALRKAVSDFIYERADPGTLGLVYYGGHGDPDEINRKSIWAACVLKSHSNLDS